MKRYPDEISLLDSKRYLKYTFYIINDKLLMIIQTKVIMQIAEKQNIYGHMAALFTMFVWGATFISTKVLLRTFTPLEILFIRFLMGFILLFLLHPKKLKLSNRKQEGLFIGAGLTGIMLYYLLENIALTYTTASNVGIILSVAPFFIGILSIFFLRAEKPHLQFYIGFFVALVGIVLISYNGADEININPKGDILAIFAAIMWGFYSIFTKKISELGHSTIQTTRHIFFYGLLFMIPLLFILDFNVTIEELTRPINLGNILFLGLLASAVCFVTWNTALKFLGAVKSSVYIYLAPVITVTAAFIILKEPLTIMLFAGAVLILIGLWISETRIFKK